MKLYQLPFLLLLVVIACSKPPKKEQSNADVSLIVLGTVQDAGSPHIGCKKECCKSLFNVHTADRMVVSLGIFDRKNNKTFLFEATPDIAQQLKDLKKFAGKESELPDGILLTHAHIGHYSGLMYLGKEAINADTVPVYAMAGMQGFLKANGPWNQLIRLNNIVLKNLHRRQKINLTSEVSVTPLLVPHRDEYSETVGFKIETASKKVLFIPDIDKWEKWQNILPLIKECDYVFIDGTFYNGSEVNNRDISEIPHPFVIESVELFKNLPASEKAKVHFIHFNHTNPLLNSASKEYQKVLNEGFKISKKGNSYEL